MRKHWLRHFHFTKMERQGIELVMLLSITLFTLPLIIEALSEGSNTDFSELDKQLAQIEPVESEALDALVATPVELTDFNPNTADYDAFRTLGLSDKLANRILNYRNKGGKFFKPEDFAKIYGLAPQEYERLRPFIAIKESRNYEQDVHKKAVEPITLEPFVFNPNEASFDDFCALGLPKRAAHSILNYREKGGKFYKKADLKKIYTLEAADYERLEAFIDLPIESKPFAGATAFPVQAKNTFDVKKEAKAVVRIDINKATAEEWQQLQGIGPSFAKRIVTYREKLGGFYSKNQIAETYGLPDSTFQKILPFLDESPIFKKINLNTVSANELVKHPYFTKKQAQLIEQYRKQHGPYKSLEDLKNIKILEEEWLNKVNVFVMF